MNTKAKRKPYDVTVRRMANGCDWQRRVFAYDAQHAGAILVRMVCRFEGLKPTDLRVVSVISEHPSITVG